MTTPAATAITFTVYGEPKTAGSKRAFYNPKLKRAIVTDDNRNSRDWKEQVASTARQVYDGDLLTGALRVTFRFVRVRPNGHYKSNGALSKAGLSAPGPATRPDVLKLARAVEDALSGVVWRDDAQICDERLIKEWGEPACVEVSITPLQG